jgi:geranylgeranyl diphosphate synthase type 3
MLHTASLLLDDIEDNSELRRGIPVAHHIYGVPSTINSANYMMFLAMSRCNKLGNAGATEAFLDEMIKLHEGQGFDILWRDMLHCPSEEEYKSMVLDKTGGLFRLAVRLMQAFSDNQEDYIPLVNSLGLFFQIQDDYMNLQSEEYAENKSFCEDLTEGKFSFPIIHAIRHNPSDHRLMNILKQRTTKQSIKMYAVSYMEQVGSFAYTREVIRGLLDDTRKLIEENGGNKEILGIVEYLAAKVFNATKLPRTPVRADKPSFVSDTSSASSNSDQNESESRMHLTLSSEYSELPEGAK